MCKAAHLLSAGLQAGGVAQHHVPDEVHVASLLEEGELEQLRGRWPGCKGQRSKYKVQQSTSCKGQSATINLALKLHSTLT